MSALIQACGVAGIVVVPWGLLVILYFALPPKKEKTR